jgi:hypothetical protein
VPLGQADRADVDARPLGGGDQLGRAAADVEHERVVVHRAAVGDAAARELGLLVAAQQAGREAVAPLDLAEEGLSVLRVADRAGADREHTLRAELLKLAPVIRERVSHARDWKWQQFAPLVDALAEPCDDRVPRDLVHAVASTSATSSRVEFVPRSTTPTRMAER